MISGMGATAPTRRKTISPQARLVKTVKVSLKESKIQAGSDRRLVCFEVQRITEVRVTSLELLQMDRYRLVHRSVKQRMWNQLMIDSKHR